MAQIKCYSQILKPSSGGAIACLLFYFSVELKSCSSHGSFLKHLAWIIIKSIEEGVLKNQVKNYNSSMLMR